MMFLEEMIITIMEDLRQIGSLRNEDSLLSEDMSRDDLIYSLIRD